MKIGDNLIRCWEADEFIEKGSTSSVLDHLKTCLPPPHKSKVSKVSTRIHIGSDEQVYSISNPNITSYISYSNRMNRFLNIQHNLRPSFPSTIEDKIG